MTTAAQRLADELEAEGLRCLEHARKLRASAEKQTERAPTAPAAIVANSRDRLIPLTEWPTHHPWPSVPALRQYVFDEAKNGAKSSIRRVGRRVLIDEAAFFKWVGQSA